MTPKYKKFSRGYEFNNFEGQPEAKPTRIGPLTNVTIPLKQGFGNEVTLLVEPNQKVAAGEIIGRDDESVSSPIHSSVNGKVIRIEMVNHLGEEIGAAVIESDGTSDWQRLSGHSSNWKDLSSEKIGELIYLSGASSCGRTGIPTNFNSSIITPEQVEDVIIHDVCSEVHNLSLKVLLDGDNLAHFIEGLKILKKVMARASFDLVLNKSQKDLVKDIANLLPTNNSFDISTVAPKYPVDRDEVLIPLLLGREFPHGYSAANIGVIVLDIQAVLHVYEAVVEGKPLIERTVALCGPGFKEKLHITARLGTPLEHVIRDNVNVDKSLRFVLNSCLTGQELSDLSLPVDRTFRTVTALLEENESQFLAFARPGFKKDSYSRTCLSFLFKKNSKMFQKKCGTNVHGELRPCIFCTFCEEVCPAGIIPHLLFHNVEKAVIDETLLKYKIFDCIECNLCSYVCPSKIPVSEFIKKGKARLIEEGFEIPEPNAALKGVEKYKSVK